jgi:hypothetical protein
MQFAVAILLTLGLLASPIACLVQPCLIADHTHDCCPRTPALTACPYDILSSAKAASDQHLALVAAVVEASAAWAPPEVFDSHPVADVPVDQSGLHLKNRVLRL